LLRLPNFSWFSDIIRGNGNEEKTFKFVFCKFISGGSIAHADDTIAGVLFGSPNQNSAVCYLFNTGSSAVAITSKYLTAENGGGKYALTYDSCKTSISAGKVCAFQATLGSAKAV
jgi:hypothetical protein